MGDRNFDCDPTCYEQNCVYYDDCDYEWKVVDDDTKDSMLSKMNKDELRKQVAGIEVEEPELEAADKILALVNQPLTVDVDVVCKECEGSGHPRKSGFMTNDELVDMHSKPCPSCTDGKDKREVELVKRCDCRCFPTHNRKCNKNKCTGSVCLSPELNDFNPLCRMCVNGEISRPLTLLDLRDPDAAYGYWMIQAHDTGKVDTVTLPNNKGTLRLKGE